jgi:hypothetical protein
MHKPTHFDVDSDDLLDMLRHVAARPPNAEREMLVNALLAELRHRGIALIVPGDAPVRRVLH